MRPLAQRLTMPYTIDVQSTGNYPMELARLVAAAANASVAYKECPDGAALTVLLTDDEHLRLLNKQYRGEDHPTDVLSFPSGDPIPGGENLLDYLGDIAISVPHAQRQAQAKGHETTAELQLLAVHGVLHLLGYDHETEQDKAEMWRSQEAILAQLGLIGINPTEDEQAG